MNIHKLSWLNTGVSLVAIVIAGASLIYSQRTEQKVYDRILNDVYEEVKPVYDDFDIKVEQPSSFRELLKPLVKLTKGLEMDDNVSNSN